MILSRVVGHLKQQDWSAVAIEFFIVIGGVFIGLQASDWNQARNDAARGLVYVARINGELRAELAQVEARIATFEVARARTERVLDALDAGEYAIDRGVLVDAYLAANRQPIGRFHDTYDELKSSGELALIRDADLRAALARHYNSMDVLAPIFDGVLVYRERVRTVLPYEAQRKIRAACLNFQRENVANWRTKDTGECDPGLSEDQTRRAARALAEAAGGPDGLMAAANRLISDLDQRIDNFSVVRSDILMLIEWTERQTRSSPASSNT